MIAWMALSAHAGTWAMVEELRTQIRPPLPVGWVSGRTETRWLVDWTPGDPTFTARLCAVRSEPVMGAVTTWPAAALAAVPPMVRPVRLQGSAFLAGPVLETIGAGDDDHDGHPGVSLLVSHPRQGEGVVFVRQTAELAWTGELDDDGVIRGTVAYDPAPELLGATAWWLRLGLSERAHVDEPSTFSLRPLRDGATCAALARGAGR